MAHTFYKYQGTGNDFVFIDNRQQTFNKNNTKLIAKLCDRRFGIGGDGLILLENDDNTDFKMVYFNADGNESSMCGNGGRCIVAFAKFLNIIEDKTVFIAVDGVHEAIVTAEAIALKMQDVATIEETPTHTFLNTGSPHHVTNVDDVNAFDVKLEGAKIRYGAPYNEAGTNVNFVTKVNENTFTVRTYERGVEDETLSCGTGVTAVALAMHKRNKTKATTITLQTEGGILQVSFKKQNDGYTDIWLKGPTQQVFKGEIEW
ncbi:diaminopimelate epimerase [Bizionia gelidisalsuginis]|uniref:Diaminopimelate epimerase n=2 Tax=Bizionia TaxID=283785 RepID=A0A8H2QG26_9FLAO|nr:MULTISPECIES: diaminopimelate epimerase [Bizionia]TYB77397.1 diaminopimelate epimerase [Bizionia saleffrena]TYC17921.1 diaminopimelate epimerase [Bizionia gelidisalsuginis]